MAARDPDSLPFERGGLPPGARHRLLAAAAGTGFFTSTFSAAELAIARLADYQPIGQVMGSSIYHVGWTAQFAENVELKAVTEAKREARALSLGRLAQEATLLGAHAVVGVQLAVRKYEWAGPLSEFTAIGTAVRVADAPPVERPALSNLSVQQLYKLELAGLWPVDIVMGNCVWYDRHADCRSDGSWFNQELPRHTACIDAAQNLAMRRLKHEVVARNALGAVGVTMQRHFVERHVDEEKHTTFTADVMFLGTAIARRTNARLPRPQLVLDLGGQKIDLNAAPKE